MSIWESILDTGSLFWHQGVNFGYLGFVLQLWESILASVIWVHFWPPGFDFRPLRADFGPLKLDFGLLGVDNGPLMSILSL